MKRKVIQMGFDIMMDESMTPVEQAELFKSIESCINEFSVGTSNLGCYNAENITHHYTGVSDERFTS